MEWKRLLRFRWADVITFVGLVLTVNEAMLRQGQPRADLLVLYAAMMGISFTTRADDLRSRVQKGRHDAEPEDGD